MACHRVASIGSKAYNVPSVNSHCPCCPVSSCHWLSKVHSLAVKGAFIVCRRCIVTLGVKGAFIDFRRCIHWVSKVISLTFEGAFIGFRRCIHWFSKVHWRTINLKSLNLLFTFPHFWINEYFQQFNNPVTNYFQMNKTQIEPTHSFV